MGSAGVTSASAARSRPSPTASPRTARSATGPAHGRRPVAPGPHAAQERVRLEEQVLVGGGGQARRRPARTGRGSRCPRWPSTVSSAWASEWRRTRPSSFALLYVLSMATTAPMRDAASQPTIHSGPLGASSATRVPLPMPEASMPFASRADSRSASAVAHAAIAEDDERLVARAVRGGADQVAGGRREAREAGSARHGADGRLRRRSSGGSCCRPSPWRCPRRGGPRGRRRS